MLPEVEHTNKLDEYKLQCLGKDDEEKYNHGKCKQSQVKSDENKDSKDAIWLVIYHRIRQVLMTLV